MMRTFGFHSMKIIHISQKVLVYLSFSKDEPRSPTNFLPQILPLWGQGVLLFLQPTLKQFEVNEMKL